MLHFGVDKNVLSKRHQACVFCGGKDRANYADKGYGIYYCTQCAERGIDGFEFLERFTMRSFKSIADEIESFMDLTIARPEQQVNVGNARNKLQTIWSEAKLIVKNDQVDNYLNNRGIEGLDYRRLHGLRFHSGLKYWSFNDKKEMVVTGTYPAMVGLIRTANGNPASLHITYLQDGQKADIETPRKIMTPIRDWKGGAIRLEKLKSNQDLCICEGIETALSMKLMHPDYAVWSCLNAGAMKEFTPPGDVNVIHIGGDNDYSYTGQAAAFELARRLRTLGKNLGSVLLPEKTDTDFNDVLINNRKDNAKD